MGGGEKMESPKLGVPVDGKCQRGDEMRGQTFCETNGLLSGAVGMCKLAKISSCVSCLPSIPMVIYLII
jgi:hypothetical protein